MNINFIISAKAMKKNDEVVKDEVREVNIFHSRIPRFLFNQASEWKGLKNITLEKYGLLTILKFSFDSIGL